MSKLTLVPAYGRDYDSAQDVQAAWESGQEFLVRDASSVWDNAIFTADDAKNSRIASVRIQFKGGILALRTAAEEGGELGGWDTGYVDTENQVWQTGEVVTRGEDGEDVEIGDGSQVPPARDDFGHQLDEDGEPMENSVARVAGTRDLEKAEKSLTDAWHSMKAVTKLLFKDEHTLAGSANRIMENIDGLLEDVMEARRLKRASGVSGWEGLARRVQRAHSKKAGSWGNAPPRQ